MLCATMLTLRPWAWAEMSSASLAARWRMEPLGGTVAVMTWMFWAMRASLMPRLRWVRTRNHSIA